jgi:hypothetical protein
MRSYLCAVLLAVSCIPSIAQSTPKVEVFGGFSYLNYQAVSVNLPNGSSIQNCTTGFDVSSCLSSSPPTVNFSPRLGLYGWNGSVTAGLTPWFGFTTDFTGNYGNATESITTTVTTTFSPCTSNCTTTSSYRYSVTGHKVHTFLFGPQFTFPAGKVKAYSHFLVGGLNKDVPMAEVTTGSSWVISAPPVTATSSTNMFAMAFGGGVDYPIRKRMAWRIGADYLTSTGTAQNHVRVSSGLVWTLGK